MLGPALSLTLKFASLNIIPLWELEILMCTWFKNHDSVRHLVDSPSLIWSPWQGVVKHSLISSPQLALAVDVVTLVTDLRYQNVDLCSTDFHLGLSQRSADILIKWFISGKGNPLNGINCLHFVKFSWSNFFVGKPPDQEKMTTE